MVVEGGDAHGAPAGRTLGRPPGWLAPVELRHLVLIVDDEDPPPRIQRALEDGGHVTLTASTIGAADRLLADRPIDVALVNVELEAGAGRDLVARIGPPREGNGDVAVVALSGETAPATVAAMLGLGAVDCIGVPVDIIELVARVASVLRWKDAVAAARLGPRDRGADGSPMVGVGRSPTTSGGTTADVCGELTPSESAVAIRAALGLTNRAIAAELFVSVKAVEFHMGHVLRKLGVANRTALAVLLVNARVAGDSTAMLGAG